MSIASELTAKILNHEAIAPEDAVKLLEDDLYDVLYHANSIRHHFRGDTIKLCSIINAKSGACSEDCAFCSQSSRAINDVEVYPLVDLDTIEEAATTAEKNGATCFGIVTSGKKLAEGDIDRICEALNTLESRSMTISASIGELTDDMLSKLKAAGLKKIHHNIETAESFFPSICSTHSYHDKLTTLDRIRKAGFELCCGGIIGLGESVYQRLELAFTLAKLDVDSVPLNILNPAPGTPLATAQRIHPLEILRTIAIFRFILPTKDISICGGREVNLRDVQSWIFYAGASGMMTGGYLTTGGRTPEEDRQMIEDLGLKVAQ